MVVVLTLGLPIVTREAVTSAAIVTMATDPTLVFQTWQPVCITMTTYITCNYRMDTRWMFLDLGLTYRRNWRYEKTRHSICIIPLALQEVTNYHCIFTVTLSVSQMELSAASLEGLVHAEQDVVRSPYISGYFVTNELNT